MHRRRALGLIGASTVLSLTSQLGSSASGRGVTDGEIRIGQTAPHSGPASGWATIARAEAAYFKMLNANGGINGRRVRFISLDDAYNPARTVEMTRLLVEKEHVLLIFNPIGSATISAARKYLNDRGVPQLFVGGGEEKWGDYRNFPWTMGFQHTTHFEGKALGLYLRRNYPNEKVAALYINDEYGKELLAGLRDGLDDRASRTLVAIASYDLHDPTIDSQMLTLRASGAEVFANFAMPKAAAQAIRKAHDSGWRPLQYLNYVSNSVPDVLSSAGLHRSIGVLSADNLRDPGDPQWAGDAASLKWRAFMKTHYPAGDVNDSSNVYAYNAAHLLESVLQRCGDDLTPSNVMRQATSIRDYQLPMIIPGVKVNTSSTDYYPLEQIRMMRFDGERWLPFGEIISP
jgi:ABC-type branched-subunit amino acid transport system substrate-binding protein